MIVDVCTYNGEKELWDIHYNILKEWVDEFIVCEAPTTFSGKPKPLYFKDIKDNYNVNYFVIDENYTDKEIKLAENSLNTRGASHWKHEFLQKESIKKALIHLDGEDIVFIGDVDEVWKMSPWAEYITGVDKLKLKVYTYYLNNRSNEQFWGTIVGKYKNIKDECLNHLRSTPDHKIKADMGWHFTSLAPYLEQKLDDSYTEESYNTRWVRENLQKNIENCKDFLGRDFIYKIDESEWPPYLKENRSKYSHLCK